MSSISASRSTFSRVLAHARVHAPWRRALPRRPVRRDVQGVELWMPWSHRLPDYVALHPEYGQNLVELAVKLGQHDSPLQVVDVGANIGDSARQILGQTAARVLAVEADEYYLGFLRRNLAQRDDVTILPRLLTTDADRGRQWSAVRRGGTTYFTDSGTAEAGTMSISELGAHYPGFDNVRLIKSDTDGYDTGLIPELARAYHASRPVLFFEFDPVLTDRVAHVDAHDVWQALNALGYDRVGFWANTGAPLMQGTCLEAAAIAESLLSSPDGPDYLDVAVSHRDDVAGRAAVTSVCTQSLSAASPRLRNE